jgi:hypothetical protein
MPQKVRELAALIEQFIEHTGALTPIPNPDYDPNAAALGGWVNRGCELSLQDGVLTLGCKGSSFIAKAGLKHSGPVGIELRARTEAARNGQVQWRTAGQAKFAPDHVVRFGLTGDNDWHEVKVEVPVKGTLIHVRLFPALEGGTVALDRIRLTDQDGAVLTAWEFDLP